MEASNNSRKRKSVSSLSSESNENTTNTATSLSPQQFLKFVNCRILNYNGDNDGNYLYSGTVTIDTVKGIITNITKLDSSEKNDKKEKNEENKSAKTTVSLQQQQQKEYQKVVEEVNNIENKDEIRIQTFDCKGHILSPGFIDIQLNGAFGVDFSVIDKVTHESINHVSQRLLSFGVTSYCPTLISCESNTYHAILPFFSKHLQMTQNGSSSTELTPNTNHMARILGIHLEGPFFEPSKRGAHPSSCIMDPMNGIHTMQHIYGSDFLPLEQNNNSHDNNVRIEQIKNIMQPVPGLSGLIRIITLAPERPGALLAIRQLTSKEYNNGHTNNNTSTIHGNTNDEETTNTIIKSTMDPIVVSCGHSNATYEQGLDALRNGATLLTHMFNSMRSFHHREPGFLGLLTPHCNDIHNDTNHTSTAITTTVTTATTTSSLKRPYYSLIADGIHIHPKGVQILHSLHPKGAILVTDAMSAMGLGDGTHSLGPHVQVHIQGKKATLVDHPETLAGSVVDMNSCIRAWHEYTNISVGEALMAATVRPSEVLQWNLGGKIQVGCLADLVLVDKELNVLDCWVSGKKVKKENIT